MNPYVNFFKDFFFESYGISKLKMTLKAYNFSCNNFKENLHRGSTNTLSNYNYVKFQDDQR